MSGNLLKAVRVNKNIICFASLIEISVQVLSFGALRIRIPSVCIMQANLFTCERLLCNLTRSEYILLLPFILLCDIVQ